FLLSLKADSATLAELARKDVALALLVSGLYQAQIAARPELAAIPWIGLAAAHTHWRDFPKWEGAAPDLSHVAEALRAIVLGAGEMLLERCQTHALSRVQFPGLFKDEDGHEGIGKFGAVKRLLSEIEAQCHLLRALAGFDESNAALVKILVSEAFGCLPGSITYNAGQIIGGSAFSEDDIFSKYYRDSACFHALVHDNETLRTKIGPDADEKLRAFVARTISQISVRSEHDAELAKLLVGAASPPQSDRQALGLEVLKATDREQPLPSSNPFSYRDALKTEQHYDYGDYLLKPIDLNEWRYVPEMLFADPELRAYHERLFKFFTENYWNKSFDGLRYYRLVEKLHMIPLEDVRAMVANGFMRIYIPKDCGGEGLLKAHYYILCPLSMRYADPSYALTIMAHSSIGTTPILLALNQDLPRAKADLQAFLANPAFVAELKSEIARMLRMLDSPEALKVKKVFEALGEKVKADIGKKPMLRAVASEFLRQFMDAGRAGLRMDLAKFKTKLQSSLQALDLIQPNAEAVIAELDRRAEAARLFLRLISAGQISAFALTEPNAGSDSGGVQTRAELKRVEVLSDSDGIKYFLLGNERKNIIDAATIDLSKIDASEYDYKIDDPAKFRYYLHNGKRIRIHDIGQIRCDGSREYYEYYELNGAKMWITNGHVAGVFCLYARAAEGPTGFLVDRHAEGLIVGRDEEKMGQRGSPTIELSLNGVRVPRENVIGIEGRGQVNALETLNVGRTGLSMTATAMTAKVLDQTCTFAREHNLLDQPWVQQIVGTMAAELYACESLAYELVGRFDHHGTKSVRTESAIGKYYTSEALHRTIAAAEKVFGIEGATQLHEIEKHRRDARVLDIYEGTNEVQRFLIIRDLVDAVLPKAGTSTRKDEETILLLQDLKAAVDTFGAQVWQNTGFQPTMFKLAEMAGYIKTIDSVQWRTAWLEKNTSSDAPLRPLREAAAARYIEMAQAEIRRLHEEFNHDLELLKQGLYPPSVRVAMLSLQQSEHKAKVLTASGNALAAGVKNIVVVLTVSPMWSPRPRVVDGQLLETHFDFDTASRAVLDQALAQRQARVTVVCAAPPFAAELLQRPLALGAAKALLVQTDSLMVDPQETARLIAQQIGLKLMPCDLIVCADPVLGTLIAGAVGVESVAGFEPVSPRDFTIGEYLEAGRANPVEIVEAGRVSAAQFVVPQVEAVKDEAAATPESAAILLRKLAGIDSVTGGATNFTGTIESATPEQIPARGAVVFVGTPDQLTGVAATGVWADSLQLPLNVVILGDLKDEQLRPLAARVAADNIFVVNAPVPAALPVLRALWKESPPAILAAGVWANEALAKFSVPFPRVQSA
ncbi:MAG: acyl-CoA dehydrogenase family protein, partial [Nitrospirae bacterium]|nr:acyl-CoA dehydrogenase family protein [Nitrospirota bacterium]